MRIAAIAGYRGLVVPLVVSVAACAPVPQRAEHVQPLLADQLVTTAERTHYARTGRYDEAVALCHQFAAAFDGVTCLTLGDSVEYRPIVALRVTHPHAHPAAVPAPTILIEAGIHAGEIEGKDAGF